MLVRREVERYKGSEVGVERYMDRGIKRWRIGEMKN